ncbi:ArsR/SmtB family transcription factor [Terriglobus aquaticus]|uniref:ArsR/SmtB family transcription factor n=1 Tax=Terriglobus aquaticus TaxID=940139 RepID=A0ABW9KNQ3_9BACT|nr:metalloregulator ArsR/SmtB family transcription factor [Terriglobus aquaticus]
MSRKGKAKTGKQAGAKPGTDSVAEQDAVRSRAEASDHQLVLVSKALSDPTRVSILRRIAAGQARCGDVRECLGVSAATLSHHMKELERAGLITSEREGRFVHASLEKKAWKQHIAELKSLLS